MAGLTARRHGMTGTWTHSGPSMLSTLRCGSWQVVQSSALLLSVKQRLQVSVVPWKRTAVGSSGETVLPRGLWHWAHSFTTGCARGHRRTGDRQVGKLGGDRQQVVSARAVTFLAADPVIGRSGPGRLEHRLGVGDVAEQAAADRVVRQWLAQVFRELGRVDGMPRGHVPERIGSRRDNGTAAARAPGRRRRARPASARGLPSRRRNRRRRERPGPRRESPVAAGRRRPPERVRDLRLGWVGDRRSRQVQTAEFGGPKEGPGMPRALLRMEGGAMTLGAGLQSRQTGPARGGAGSRHGTSRPVSRRPVPRLIAPSCRYARLKSQKASGSGPWPERSATGAGLQPVVRLAAGRGPCSLRRHGRRGGTALLLCFACSRARCQMRDGAGGSLSANWIAPSSDFGPASQPGHDGQSAAGLGRGGEPVGCKVGPGQLEERLRVIRVRGPCLFPDLQRLPGCCRRGSRRFPEGRDHRAAWLPARAGERAPAPRNHDPSGPTPGPGAAERRRRRRPP